MNKVQMNAIAGGKICYLSITQDDGTQIYISTISNHVQWVYLHRYEGNERLIDDSAFIKKGQKEVILYRYLPEEDSYSILFSKKGPIDMYLILAPNSYVETELSEADGMRALKKVKGSYATNEY